MRRRTTPLEKFEFPVDGNSYQKIRINFTQDDKIVLIKTETDLTFSSEVVSGVTHYYGSVRLTQAETLKFKAGVPLIIEVDLKDADGIVPNTIPVRIDVYEVKNKEEL